MIFGVQSFRALQMSGIKVLRSDATVMVESTGGGCYISALVEEVTP